MFAITFVVRFKYSLDLKTLPPILILLRDVNKTKAKEDKNPGGQNFHVEKARQNLTNPPGDATCDSSRTICPLNRRCYDSRTV